MAASSFYKDKLLCKDMHKKKQSIKNETHEHEQ